MALQMPGWGERINHLGSSACLIQQAEQMRNAGKAHLCELPSYSMKTVSLCKITFSKPNWRRAPA